MNGAHYHLLVNHLPIIIPFMALAMLIAGFILKADIIKRAALFLFVGGALFAFAAAATGDGAVESIAKIPAIEDKFINAHEHVADTFALLSYILGVISLAGIWASFKKKAFANIIVLTALVFSLLVLFYAKQAGTTGGEIRHTEIR